MGHLECWRGTDTTNLQWRLAGAEKSKALAAYEEAVSAYQETVLQAFREVADVLLAIEDDAQVFEARSQAATQAESSYQIASQRYVAGGISQLAMLNVQHQQLQTALDRIAYQAAATLSVTLFQAGGGWWNEKPASGVIGASHSSRLP